MYITDYTNTYMYVSTYMYGTGKVSIYYLSSSKFPKKFPVCSLRRIKCILLESILSFSDQNTQFSI